MSATWSGDTRASRRETVLCALLLAVCFALLLTAGIVGQQRQCGRLVTADRLPASACRMVLSR